MNRWLLALTGVLDAAMSAVYFTHDSGFNSRSTIALLGYLALAAGVCAIAVALWRSTEVKSWLLVLNGIALGSLGLLLAGAFGQRIGLQTIALLFAVMATSLGVFQLTPARNLVSGLAGAVSFGFALVFLGLAFGWIKVEPTSNADLLWMGGYFGFSALCMLGLALRATRPSPPSSSGYAAAPPPASWLPGR